MTAARHPLQPLRATCSDGFLLGLESLMRRKDQGRHLAATVIECEGRPDEAALRHTAAVLGARHPVLHARITRSRRDWIARWRVDQAGTAPLPLFFWKLPGTVGDGRETESRQALIHSLVNGASGIDVFCDGPNLEFHVLRESKERWCFILLWSHSLHDAVGIDRLLLEIADPGDDAGIQASDGPSSGDEAMSALYKKAFPMIEEMRRFPAWRIRSPHRRDVPAGMSRFEAVTFEKEDSETIRSKMASTGGELLRLPYFAACAARAVRSVLARRYPEEEVPALLSLPVQRQGNRPLFQNHMAVYTLLITAEELAELKTATRALYRKYADFMRRKLPGAMDALMRLMERCPSRFYNLPAFIYLRGELCTLFHSHTGAFAPGLETLAGSRVTNGFHVPTVCSPPGVGIFFSDYDGRLSLTLSWKEGCFTSGELELLKRTLAEDLGVPLP